VPARGDEPFDAKSIKTAVYNGVGVWGWVFWQWWAYSAIYVGLAVSLVLVAVWHVLRARRMRARAKGEGPHARASARLKATLACVSRSALAMAACWLLVSLAIAPSVLRSVDRDHQRNMKFFRNPEAYWAALRAEIARVEADSETMEAIRAEVEAQIASEMARAAARANDDAPSDRPLLDEWQEVDEQGPGSRSPPQGRP
jgi:hypothetical protein